MCLPKCGEEAFRGDTRLKFAQNAIELYPYSEFFTEESILHLQSLIELNLRLLKFSLIKKKKKGKINSKKQP